jgi:hypothetical protein
MYHGIGPVAAGIASAGIAFTGGITLAGLNFLWMMVAGATLLFAELAICKIFPKPKRSPHRNGSRPRSDPPGHLLRSHHATALGE